MQDPDTGNWGLSDNLVEVEIHFVQVELAVASVVEVVVAVVVAQVVGLECRGVRPPVP